MTGRAAQIARSSFQAVLEISRLESGLVKPALTVFGVQDFVTEVLAPLRIVAEANGVKVRVRETGDDRSMVRSDRALLSRAVANLASNAIKYTDPAKGERQAMLIGVVPLPNRVRVDVIDNGIGIPQCKWSEVFRPFVQLHNPEHNREKGLGLGLSIVNAILAVLPEHRLDMRSIEGRGTRFSLYVPRYSGSAFPPIEIGARMGRVADLSSLFIWYVEVDEFARVATGAFLEELGILTEQASSFEELEQGLLFTERRPDLVITDYRLPGGRTAEDVIAMFVRRWGVDMPVIVLTDEAAHGSAETLGGNVAALKKPTSPEEIIAAISRLCFTERDGPAAGDDTSPGHLNDQAGAIRHVELLEQLGVVFVGDGALRHSHLVGDDGIRIALTNVIERLQRPALDADLGQRTRPPEVTRRGEEPPRPRIPAGRNTPP